MVSDRSISSPPRSQPKVRLLQGSHGNYEGSNLQRKSVPDLSPLWSYMVQIGVAMPDAFPESRVDIAECSQCAKCLRATRLQWLEILWVQRASIWGDIEHQYGPSGEFCKMCMGWAEQNTMMASRYTAEQLV
ncbi:hypothetical protein C8R43DRAFT_962802 [Mycena crocata]|nr:hypothetical protein C8R43DRAFT_962802 [Mycena crocata]